MGLSEYHRAQSGLYGIRKDQVHLPAEPAFEVLLHAHVSVKGRALELDKEVQVALRAQPAQDRGTEKGEPPDSMPSQQITAGFQPVRDPPCIVLWHNDSLYTVPVISGCVSNQCLQSWRSFGTADRFILDGLTGWRADGIAPDNQHPLAIRSNSGIPIPPLTIYGLLLEGGND